MYLSPLHRRLLLSGGALIAAGLASVPASAQNGNSKNPGALRHRRLKLPPIGDFSTPQQKAAFMAQLQALNPGIAGYDTAAAAQHIAQMPAYQLPGGGDGTPPASGGTLPGGGGSLLNTGGGGASAPSLFSFGRGTDFSLLSTPTPQVIGSTGTGNWVNTGPFPLTPYNSYGYSFQFGGGPSNVSGRANALTFDPNNSSVAYMAAPAGGIWKSANGGKTWTPITETLATHSFSSIAVAPSNSQVLYAGTGDYDGYFGGQTLLPGAGVYVSSNGGSTWTNIDPNGTNFGTHAIPKILVDPTTPGTILVAVGRDNSEFDDTGSIYRVTNATGTTPTFTKVLAPSGNVHNLVYNANHTRVYASVESFFGGVNYTGLNRGVGPNTCGIYTSVNNGVTWTESARTDMWVDVAASQFDANAAYFASSDIFGQFNQVFKSTNQGATWVETTHNFPTDIDPISGGDHVWDQSDYDFYIATSQKPTDPAAVARGLTSPPVDVVYVGLKDVYQSVDAGNTWGPTLQTYTGADLAHTDQHGFAVDPRNPGNMLIANDGGVYSYVYDALGQRFTITSVNGASSGNPLALTTYYKFALNPSSPSSMLGGAQDNGTSYSFGSPSSFQFVTGGDGSGVAINPVAPATMYSAYPGDNGPTSTIHINLTDDSWNTITDISHNVGMENAPFIQTIAIDPQNPNHLYAGSNNLWLYDHTAKSWTEILDESGTAFKPLTGDVVTAIAPSGINPQGFEPTVYVGCGNGEVYTIGPAGDNPASAFSVRQIFQDPQGGEISSIVVSRVNLKRIFVTTRSGGVYRCDDAIGGGAFVSLHGTGTTSLPNIPMNSVALLARDDESTIYVGSDMGIFAGTVSAVNGSISWANASVPLGQPNLKARNLDYNPSTGLLTTGSFGRGVWQLPINNKNTVHFAPTLTSYRGSKTGLTIRVEARKVGDPNTAVPVETHTGVLTANGSVDITFNVSGHYDFYITIPRFLRQKLPNVSTIGSPTLAPVMRNGDANGDNAVTQADVAAIQAALGRYATGVLDLDGDGRITTSDQAIALANLGKVGD